MLMWIGGGGIVVVVVVYMRFWPVLLRKDDRGLATEIPSKRG